MLRHTRIFLCSVLVLPSVAPMIWAQDVLAQINILPSDTIENIINPGSQSSEGPKTTKERIDETCVIEGENGCEKTSGELYDELYPPAEEICLSAVETCSAGTGSNISPACFVDQLKKVEEGECILKDPNAPLFGSNASMQEAVRLDVDCETGGLEFLGVPADPRCDEWLRQKSLAENDTKAKFVNEVFNTSVSLSPNTALIVIVAESGWTGAVMDSDFDMRSVAGYGNNIREFYCGMGSYSITIQNDSTLGILRVLVIQGDKVIDEGATGANYGIVSLSGSCGSQGAGMDLVVEAVQMGKIH